MTAVHTQPQHVTEADASPLAAALARFQAEMPTVSKSKTADTGTYRYTYADLAAVTEAAMPGLTAQGLSFSTVPRYTDHGYELVGVLLHSSGESMEGALPIHGQSAQQLGSAITYARRYLFGCMTGVVTDDDDDGQSASRPVKKAAAKKAAAEPPGQDPRLASTAQKAMIMTLMKELGLSQRAAALDYVESTIGRRVQSRNELTIAEASAVIEALQTRGAPAPPTPVGPTDEAVPPSAEEPVESTGPPRPVDPDAEYRRWVQEEARRAGGVEDVPLPEPEPDESRAMLAADTELSATEKAAIAADLERPPVRPPALVTKPTAERIRRFLKQQLGTVATEAEERALLAAIVGHPVESVEALSRDEGQRAGAAFNRFDDGSLAWEFDPSDSSPVPAVRLIEQDASGDGAP